MPYKYNKGEWSELYAFLNVLASGELYAADEALEKDDTTKYKVLSAFQKDIEYIRDSDNQQVFFEYNSKQYCISLEEFERYSKKLFTGIKDGNGSTFPIEDLDNFIDQLKIFSLKSSSRNKGDLLIKIDDIFSARERELNFSIKSYIGSHPTLLNASDGTILEFSLSRPIPDQEIVRINNINTRSKIKERIQGLKDIEVELQYKNIESNIFKKNLQMIDSKLPELISELYLESYFVRGKRISEVVDSFLTNNPDKDREIVVYKVKQFLIAIALGMVPLTPWSGLDEANGGYIVVKDNAEVLCYHIYDRNRLSNYLYNHTAFDTPSTGRTKVGLIKKETDDSQKFQLTMQIRFY
ncbi:HpaII family restriction endonuclease [Tetragenococcus halophilus]